MLNPITSDAARAIFGDHPASSLREWASKSERQFVRTQFQLSVATGAATGVRLNALEALNEFGWDCILRLADNHSVPLVESAGEPFSSIETTAAQLGLDLRKLQLTAGWDEDDLERFSERRQIGFRKWDRLASQLGFRSADIGKSSNDIDKKIIARLRTLKGDSGLKISDEIVRIIGSCTRIAEDFFYLSSTYNDAFSPRVASLNSSISWNPRETVESMHNCEPWQVGFQVADELRVHLMLSADRAVQSVRRLAEFDLDILLILAKSKENFSGITIQKNKAKAIILNINSGDGLPIFQRSSLAHEIGHYLMDSEAELNNVRVDQARMFENNINEKDPVESRANAFAAQLLAPQSAVSEMYTNLGSSPKTVSKMMSKFGVSRSVIKLQLQHGPLSIPFDESIGFDQLNEASSSKWISRELNSVCSRMQKFDKHTDIIYLNKLMLLAKLLNENGRISNDSLISFCGYPKSLNKLKTSIDKEFFLTDYYRDPTGYPRTL